MEKRLCKDCGWTEADTTINSICHHPKAPRSFVTGEPVYHCIELRHCETSERAHCGLTGDWWEPREKQEW